MSDDQATFKRFETSVNVNPKLAILSKLSPEVVGFLAAQGLSGEEVLSLPVVKPPPVDDTLPLVSYFISTSHNTYLLNHQLWGKSSPHAYTDVLLAGARCVEIDVWPSDAGPKVTHGYTLTDNIPFRDACRAIAEAIQNDDDWPVFVSLECHVGVDGQEELVTIMREEWGARLVDSEVEGVEVDKVTPGHLRGRIVLMVEYYPPLPIPGEVTSSSSSSSSSSSDDEDEKSKKDPKPKISDDLHSLGLYARSMKPGKHWLTQDLSSPHNILINISESTLLKLLRASSSILTSLNLNLSTPITRILSSHALRHLRRVYPRGTRFGSSNLDPLPFWRAGSQFVCLNWQEYDRGMQMNEAMFVGGEGWVVKPEIQRGGEAVGGRTRVRIEVVALSGLPHPEGDSSFAVRIRVQLFHALGECDWTTKSIKCKRVTVENGADAFFDEKVEWTIEKDDLAFIRILAMEDEFGKDDKMAVFCARLTYIQQGWRLVHLLDMHGRDTHATLLVRFTVDDVE